MNDLERDALAYHNMPSPGKLSIVPTRPISNQHELSLAYSPGVAFACEAIAADPNQAFALTGRGNLIAVVSNGTAVLGLGAIGPLASKPVMESKAALFKLFAGIDAFDLELAADDPALVISTVAALEPTFGGINLEDIRAPECFHIESTLRSRMAIPVFHDDQHGTAIVCAAAVKNALTVQGKRLQDVRLVTSGAGAAAIACVDLLVSLGLPAANVTLTDIHGLVFAGRSPNMPEWMARYAQHTNARTLREALNGCDIFLGLSAANILSPEWLTAMNPDPLIMALANPEPEIRPEAAWAVRPDAIIATGRSDYPNQVNNLLCFPYIFRGALDVGAAEIDSNMTCAAVDAIARLACVDPGDPTTLDRERIIPNPFDPRLLVEVSSAVAHAAMMTGNARRPIADISVYRAQLERLSAQLRVPGVS